MFDPRSASPLGSPRQYGAGTGTTRAEATLGMPLSGLGADISVVGGKRHFAPAASVVTPRTKAEVMSGGMLLSGSGADISLAGGRRLFPSSSTKDFEYGAASPRRSKIEALHGVPMAGRGADIALAGGRRYFLDTSSAGLRGESAPPCPAEWRNSVFRDEHLMACRGLIGRSPRGNPAKSPPTPRVRPTRSARYTEPGSPKAGGNGARKNSSAVSTPSSRRIPRKSAPATLDPTTLDLLASSQRLKVAIDLDQSCTTLGSASGLNSSGLLGSDDSASDIGTATSGGATPALPLEFDIATPAPASLTSALAQSMSLARTIQGVVEGTPAESSFSAALDTMLKEKMETAWAILSKELDLPNEGKRGPRSRASRGGYTGPQVSRTVSSASSRPHAAARAPSGPQGPAGSLCSHVLNNTSSSSDITASPNRSCSDLLGVSHLAADGLAGSTYMSNMSSSSLVIPESTPISGETPPAQFRVLSVQKLPHRARA